METKRLKFVGIGLMLILGLAIITGCTQKAQVTSPDHQITIFKSPGCGCCGIYSKYMENEGFGVNVKNMDSLDSIKSKFNIPEELQSCHTTEMGDYFIEGHVPVEAIERLLTEKPDIAGLAMKGMPSGSPGMPGNKAEPFVIYSVDYDGNYEEFMRI